MDRIDVEKFKRDHIIRTFVQQEQFGQWLRKFFYLNEALNKEYDTMYQDMFYIVFYELLTTGNDYAKKVEVCLTGSENLEKIEFYNAITKGLTELQSSFSWNEFQFIEYKRHNASHLFQNHYENIILDSGKIQTTRKGKPIDFINEELQSILKEHKTDRNFDIYMTKKLYPKTLELYNRLDAIKRKYNDNKI
jgi:hypothetical protein